MPHSGHVQLAIRSLCARESSFRKSDPSAPSAPPASRNPADPSRQRAPPSRRIRGRRTALSPSPVSPRRTARPRPCRNSGSAARTPRRRAATQSTASASLPCFPYQVAGMRPPVAPAAPSRDGMSQVASHQTEWLPPKEAAMEAAKSVAIPRGAAAQRRISSSGPPAHTSASGRMPDTPARDGSPDRDSWVEVAVGSGPRSA